MYILQVLLHRIQVSFPLITELISVSIALVIVSSSLHYFVLELSFYSITCCSLSSFIKWPLSLVVSHCLLSLSCAMSSRSRLRRIGDPALYPHSTIHCVSVFRWFSHLHAILHLSVCLSSLLPLFICPFLISPHSSSQYFPNSCHIHTHLFVFTCAGLLSFACTHSCSYRSCHLCYPACLLSRALAPSCLCVHPLSPLPVPLFTLAHSFACAQSCLYQSSCLPWPNSLHLPMLACTNSINLMLTFDNMSNYTWNTKKNQFYMSNLLGGGCAMKKVKRQRM